MNGTWKALFDRYPKAARPTSALEPLGNAGGLSGARLYRFHSGLGLLVARLWPIDGPDLGRLLQIHRWLEKARGLGFVPAPIPSVNGSTAVELDGRIWEVDPWMPGQANLSRPPSPALLHAAFGGLAAFLSRFASMRSEGTSPGLAVRSTEIQRLMLDEFEAIRAKAGRSPTDPASASTLLWIERAIPLAPSIAKATRRASQAWLPLQPCLRDVRPDHFLFEGDRLSGLVDFGAMGRDSVSGDLARLLAEWVGPDRVARRTALEAFEAIHPLSQAELHTIEAFQRANALLGAGRWARWHFLEGRTFDDPDAVIRGLARGLERLDEMT